MKRVFEKISRIAIIMATLFLISKSIYAQEICNNGIDDDADGMIDCFDNQCYTSPYCALPSAQCEITADPGNAEFATKLECAYLKGGFMVGGVIRNFTPYGYDTPKVGDVDGDGKVEIIAVGDGYGGTGDEGVYIFDPSNCEPKYYIARDISGNHGGISFANVDADPYAEIFVTTGNDGCATNANSLIRYDFDGIAWNQTWIISNIYQKRGFPVDFVDFNEDGTSELVVYGWTTDATRTAKVLRASDGATLVDLTTNATFRNRLYWKDVFAFADVIPTGFDPDGAGPKTALQYANGPEIIAGNRIYTVDIASGNIEDVYGVDPLTSTGSASDHFPWSYNHGDATNPANQQDNDGGQKNSLADINMDGVMDIITVGQGRLSVWNPLTNQRLYPTFVLAGDNLTAGKHDGGVACIGDVDGLPDNRPEMGIVSTRRFEMIRVNDAGTALQRMWQSATTDQSGETAMNFFDFEGDGKVELVYRDQDTLKVYVGVGDGAGNAKILFQDANHCGSGTGGEHAVIADIDDDNRAEIIASCTEGIRVYRDNRTPWISARKVFNQRAYNYVNINNDLTVPKVQQKNHLVPYLNNYLTQLYRIDQSGDKYFPGPDFTVEVEDVTSDVDISSSCPDKVIIRLKICNRGDALANYTIPMSFYQNDPRNAGAIFLKKSMITVTLNASECYKTEPITVSLSDLVNSNGANDGNLYFVVNDDADGLAPNQVISNPISIPNSPYGECNYSNNIYGPIKIVDCHFVPIIHLLTTDVTLEDQPLTFTSLSSNQILVTDYDNDAQTVTINVTGGTITLSGTTGLTFTSGDGNSDASMIFSGSLVDVNNALNNAVFTPESNYSGTATVQVKSSDGLGEDVKIINVAVTPVNDNPVINDVNMLCAEDNFITFAPSDFTNSYSDPDNDALNKIKIITLPPYGVLKLSGVAVTAGQEISFAQLGNLIYVPDANWNGAITCDYNSSDGTLYASTSKKIWLTVTPVNDKPVLSDIYKSSAVNAATSFATSDFTASYFDADANPLEKVQINSLPAKGTLYYGGSPVGLFYEIMSANLGLLTYQPNTGYSGTDEFNWNAYDGTSYALTGAQVKFVISNTNVAPVISGFIKNGTEDNELSFAATDFLGVYSDANADALNKIRIETLPGNGTLLLSGVAISAFQEITATNLGNITFAPNANWNGSTSFSWKAYDGLTYSSSSANVTINISAVNDLPVVADFSKAGTENITLAFTAADFTNAYTDIDNDALAKIRVVTLPANGTLKLSGANIIANQEIIAANLANITFVPNADWSGNTSFTWNGNDGSAYASSNMTVNIVIANVNNAPVLAGIEAGALSFTEDELPKIITSSITISDIDNTTFRNATIKITGNYNSGQDVLSFTNTATITGTWNLATGTLNLVGTDTKANYEAALRSVKYQNTSDDPATSVRTVSFTISDGSGSSNTQTRNINIVAVNDAPILENIETTALVTPQLVNKVISNTITIKDFDDSYIESASVKLSINYVNGQDVLQFTNTATITGVWTPATGILTLTGTDTKANYEAALRSVTYRNNSSTPNTNARTIVFTVNDGNLNSNIQFRSVNISVANNPPVLAAIEGAALAYTENAAATNVTASMTVSDDGPNLQGAEVQITGNYQSGQDVLSFTATGSIVGIWNAATGKISFSGTDTKANYQTILRSVKYANTSENPSTLVRTVSYTVNDGEYNSNVQTRNINVTKVNDLPVVAALNKSANVSTDVTFTLADFTSHFTDADGDAMTQIQIGAALPANGTLYRDANSNGVVDAGEAVAANAVITNANIPFLKFKPTAAWSGTTTFNWNGYDGTAYAATAAAVNIAISNNTPPVIQAFSKSGNEDTDLAFAASDFGNAPTYTDAESNAMANVQITTLPANGTLYRDANSNGLVDAGEATTVGQVYTSAQLALLKFKPTSNWNGSTSFTWMAQDNNAIPKYSTTAVNANITVTAINDAPTTANFSVTTLEDVDKVFAISDFPYMDVDAGDVLVRIRIVSIPGTGVLYNDANLNGIVDGGETLAATNIVSATDINAGKLKFKPVANGNGTPYTTFQFNVGDVSAYSGNATMTINVTPQQEAAVLSAIEGTTLNYTENAGPMAISSTINLTDIDNTQAQSATVKITNNYQYGQDFLSFSDNIFISSSWDQATGTLTLTGPADISYFISALRTVYYQNTSDDPSTLTRTISFNVNDGTVNSNTISRNISIVAVNDAPVLANIESASLLYTENDAATNITSNLTLADPDNTDIQGATVQITSNYQNGQDVLSFINTGSITGSWNVATGTMTLSGTDTKANYLAALKSVKYVNTSENPNISNRSVSFSATDGLLNSNTVSRTIQINSINGAPTSANNTVTTNEDVDKIFSDTDFPYTDIEGDALAKVMVTSLESAGSLYLDLNGNSVINAGEDITLNQEILVTQLSFLKFKPAANANGTAYATFGFKVNDGSVYAVAENTMTINVLAVNDAPTSADNAVTIVEDNQKTFASAEFPFSDIDAGDVLTKIRIASLPGAGTLFNDANLNNVVEAGEILAVNDEVTKAQLDAGYLKFRPVPDANGSPYVLFQFDVYDGVSYSASSYNMTINVTAVNDAPTITSSSTVSVAENTTAVIAVTAYDPDAGDPKTFSISGGADQALFSINALTGDLSFISGRNYENPTDANTDNIYVVDVRVTDGGGLTNTQSISVTVTNVNEAPTVADFTVNGTEDNTFIFAATDFTSNYTDVEGSALSSIKVITLPANGILKLSGVNIAINDVIAFANLGNISFVPTTDWNGSTSFDWNASDGSLFALANKTVTINVTAVNDAPVLAAIEAGALTYTENAVATAITSTLTVSDADNANMASATVQITGGYQSAEDVLSFTNTASITGTWNSSTGTMTLTGSDTKANYQAALRAVKYANSSDNPTTAARTVTFTVNDGTAGSNTQTRTINITAVNDAPTASNSTVSTIKNIQKVFNVASFGYSDIEGDALTLVKITNLPASGTLYNDANLNGSIDAGEAIAMNGTINKADIDAGQFKFKAPFNDFGAPYASFDFKVYDGIDYSVSSYTITININSSNTAPTAVNKALSTNEDTYLSIVTADLGYADVDGDVLNHLQITMLPAIGVLFIDANSNNILDAGEPIALNGTISKADIDAGKLLYSPASNGNGISYASFSFKVNDGNVYSTSDYTITIDVTAVNDAPVVSDFTVNGTEDNIFSFAVTDFTGNYADVEGTALSSIKVISLPANGLLKLSGLNIAINDVIGTADLGSITFVPSANWNGSTTFDWNATDGALYASANKTITISIAAINDAPVVNDTTFFIAENTATATSVGTVSATDADADALTYSITSGNTGTAFAINASTGEITVNGALDYETKSSYTLTVHVSDGVTSDDATITINITNVNDNAPVSTVDSYTVAEGGSLNISAPGVLANDNDVDGDALFAVLVSGTTHGSLAFNADGSFSYTHDGTETTSDTFTYKANDGLLNGNTVSVSVSVTAVNDAPVLTKDTIKMSIPINKDTTFDVCSNVTDAEGATPTIIIGCAALHGSASVSGCNITYNPIAGYSGNDTICYTACDNGTPNKCVTGYIVIKINSAPSDNAPIIDPGTTFVVSTTEDIPQVVIVVSNSVSDPDGDSLVFSISDAPKHGNAIINANGDVVYVPAKNYFGNDTIVFTACDITTPVQCVTDTIYITVANVNDAPVLDNDTILKNTNENEAVIIDITAISFDPDSDILTTSVVNGPSNGSIKFKGNDIVYTPSTGFAGNDTLYFSVCDNGAPKLCSSGMIVISVINSNKAPVAVNDIFEINEDNTFSGNVLANDFDPNGGSLTALVSINPVHGAIMLNFDGTIIYTPEKDYFGKDSVQYLICNNGSPSLCNNAWIVFTVKPVNDKPVCSVNNGVTNENTALNIDLLSNITDIDNSSSDLIVSVLVNPTGGTVKIYNGTLIYTPNIGFTGQDTIILNICDNGIPSQCTSDTIIIHVLPVPAIAIAKSVATPDVQADDSYDITYTIYVKNMGSTKLNDVLVGDNLISVFPEPAIFKVKHNSISANGNLIVNPNYDGAIDTMLLLEGSTLEGNEMATITFTVNVYVEGDETTTITYNNIARASAKSINGKTVIASSINGIIPEIANGEPTPVNIKPVEFFVPEGFSPNGDGYYDNFIIRGGQRYIIHLQVYNRWGNLVYENKNYKNDWDGKTNIGITVNSTLPDGTYFYIAKFNKNRKPIQGYITINK
ncbi:MAG TPA: Ig-like domain-containing protein [Bacteroidales bacterium]|nr:Ig-like domain-containing protein [Bacteroidales bacterium]